MRQRALQGAACTRQDSRRSFLFRAPAKEPLRLPDRHDGSHPSHEGSSAATEGGARYYRALCPRCRDLGKGRAAPAGDADGGCVTNTNECALDEG